MQLRWYQEKSIERTQEEWEAGNNRVVVVLPTGMGKTFIFAFMAVKMAREGKRVVILVNRDVLVQQTVGEVRTLNSILAKNGMGFEGRIGIVRGSDNQVDARIIVASVQTIQRLKRAEQIRNVAAVIVDECHMSLTPQYRVPMEYFGCYNGLPTVGFTATPMHNTLHFGDVWPKVAFRMTVLQGIAGGWICDAKGYRVETDIDLDGVRRSGGDFQDSSLGNAMITSNAAEQAVKAVHEYGNGRPGIVFTPNVASAEMYAEIFTANGIPLACISAKTTKEERKEIFARRRAGELMGYANCNTLTAGFDDPALEWCIPRLTESQNMYIQQVGRVMRTYVDRETGYVKPHAVVLDITGVSARQSLMCLPDLSQSSRRRTVAEDETLVEAAKRWRKEDIRDGWLDIEEDVGPYMLRAVDLFANSQSAWLRTYSGQWFIPTREGVVFLFEQGDTDSETPLYSIGKTYSDKLFYDPNNEDPLVPIASDLPLDMAMMAAEEYALELDATVASRNARWRKGAPSDAQVSLAMSFGLDCTEVNKGQLSDRISVYKTSALIDWLANG